MENDFRAWLAKAKPGDRFEYHRGFLAVDLGGESKKRKFERRALRELSDAVLRAGQMGLVRLVQRRRGPEDYHYLAVRTAA